MSDLSVGYYSHVLKMSAEEITPLVGPKLVFGIENEKPQGVRRLEDRGFVDTVNQRTRLYVEPFTDAIGELIDMPVGVGNYGFARYPGVHELLPKLLHKKIVTGALASLMISALSPDELSEASRKQFKTDAERWRSTQRPIQGFDSYFRFIGQIKIASRIASVGCLAHLYPALCASISSYDASKYPNGTIDFKVVVRPLEPRVVQADSELWGSLIAEATLREGANAVNPLQGGLVNPR